MLMDQNQPPEQQLTEDQRIKNIFMQAFADYVDSKKLDPQQTQHVKIREFVGHARHYLMDVSADEPLRDDFLAKTQATREDLKKVMAATCDPYDAVALLLPIWHMMILSRRSYIEQKPSFVHLSLVMGFNAGTKDERAFQIQVPTPIPPDEELSDGFLCSLLRMQFEGILQSVAENGVDALYINHALSVGVDGEYTFEQKLTVPNE